MQPEDIGRLVGVSAPAVSPDGTTVAYVVSRLDVPANRGRSALWLTATDGSTAPRQLTSGRFRDGAPRWSPDGTRLAFTADRGADDAHRHGLYLLPVVGSGEVVPLHEGPEPVESLAWSPDGARLAFTTRVRTGDSYTLPVGERPPRRITRLFARVDDVGWTVDRPLQLLVVPADGSATATLLTAGDRDHSDPAFSPDGRRIAVVAALHPDADLDVVNDLYLVDVVDPGAPPGAPRRITRTDTAWALPSWRGDGAVIAAYAVPRSLGYRHPQLALVDVATGDHELVSEKLDRSTMPYPYARPPLWVGHDVLFSIEDAGAVTVHRHDAGGAITPVVEGRRVVTGVDAVGETVAFTATTPEQPTELFVRTARGERRLTSHQDAFLAACPPAVYAPLDVTSEDGLPLDAWIATPRDLDRSAAHAALVIVHGGPHTQYGYTFFDEVQLAAGAGMVVVLVNPHGATGGTEAFARSILSPLAPDDPGTGWGGIDYRDVLAATDAAAALPFVDDARIGIHGGSYGGYMTSWAIGHTDRYAAACSERAVNHMLSLEWSSDAGGYFRFALGVGHLEHPEEYLRMSPVTYAADIRTPVLILHSEDDLRCHVEQADALYVALRLLRRDVTYYRFEGEGHELSRSGSPRHRIQRATLVRDWFTGQLAATGDPGADAAHPGGPGT